eukprot:3143480-Pleurochrysis_carterae.AAC.1
MRRFGIEQGEKIRACEHALESGHNAATTLHERIRCVGADFPARIGAAFAHKLGWENSEWAHATGDRRPPRGVQARA